MSEQRQIENMNAHDFFTHTGAGLNLSNKNPAPEFFKKITYGISTTK